MILPIHTSVQPRRKPYVNYALIAVNAVIWVVMLLLSQTDRDTQLRLAQVVRELTLKPEALELPQFITYAFLHAGFLHVFFNMLFLYIFGNNVNDRMGHFPYLCFYLAGAVFSGLGHTLLNASPVVGASGAVAAVTGAYLVLFPRSLITVIYFIFIIGTLQVPAIYFIIFKLIVIDNILVRTGGNVAYDAHLAGYFFGVVSLLLILITGILSPSGSDLWTMIRQWNRRRRYRKVVSAGYDPFSGTGPGGVFQGTAEKKSQDPRSREIDQLRDKIADRMNQRNIASAAEAYLDLMELDDSQLIPRAYLLDIANQLAGQHRYREAARAYNQFLESYGNYEYADQVELMLGLLYARHLKDPQKAKEHLEKAMNRLADPEQVEFCRREIQKLPL